jgi:general secretion pathway protein N
MLGLAATLALFAPARWLAAQVESTTGGMLRLADARGTVWRGNAQLVLAGGTGSSDTAALPGRVEWRLRPGLVRATLELSAACCTPSPLAATLQPRWGGVRVALADGRSHWPAGVLRGLGTPWNTLEPAGDLAIATRGLVLDAGRSGLAVAGSAELLAERMATRVSPLRPLGSYRLAMAGGSAPTLVLSTLEGALQLEGSGSWAGQRLRFAGSASARPGDEAALANLLNIIGRRQGARSLITIG